MDLDLAADRQLRWPSTPLREALVEIGDGPGELLGGDPERQPARRIVGDHLEGFFGRPPDPDGRVRLLLRLGVDRRRSELDVATLECGRVFRPDLAHDLEILAGSRHLVGARDAQDFEVFVQGALGRALPDAQLEAAVTQHVDGGDLLGRHQWLSIGQAEDRDAQSDPFSDGGQEREVDQGLVEDGRIGVAGGLDGFARPARDVDAVERLVPDDVVVNPDRIESERFAFGRDPAHGVRTRQHARNR